MHRRGGGVTFLIHVGEREFGHTQWRSNECNVSPPRLPRPRKVSSCSYIPNVCSLPRVDLHVLADHKFVWSSGHQIGGSTTFGDTMPCSNDDRPAAAGYRVAPGQVVADRKSLVLGEDTHQTISRTLLRQRQFRRTGSFWSCITVR